MKKIRLLSAIAVAVAVGALVVATRPVARVDERYRFPFDTATQTGVFLERLLAADPPGSLAPPKERAEWEEARAFYRHELGSALGLDLLPERPLNPRFGTTVAFEGYRVVPLTFDALPGMHANADLYLPAGVAAPFPALLLTAGATGSDDTAVRRTAATFAAAGVAVLALDPPEGGERERTGSGDETLLLSGLTPLGILVWDMQRAIAFLRTRADIDPRRIAVAGAARSGTAAIYTAALDDTIAAGAAFFPAPSFRTLAGSGDAPELLIQPRRSFEQHHALALVAPRPFLVISAEKEASGHAAGIETVRRARAIYRFLGVEERLEHSDRPGPRRLTAAHRAILYEFLTRTLGTPPVPEENEDIPDRTVLSDDRDTGADTTLTEFARREALILRDIVRTRRDDIGPVLYGIELDEALRDLAGAALFGQTHPLDPVIHEVHGTDTGTVEALSVASGDGSRIPMLLTAPTRWVNAVIVLSPGRLPRHLARDLAQEGILVLEADLRRVRDDRSLFRFFRPDRGRRTAVASLTAGLPLAAQWADDIGAAARYLSQRAGPDIPIGLYAEGPDAALATLLATHRDDRIGWLALNGVPATLVPDATGNNELIRELALQAPRLLRYGDIADLIATLAPRRTLVTGVTGPGDEKANAGILGPLLWEKRHVLLEERPDRATIVRFLQTRGTTPAP